MGPNLCLGPLIVVKAPNIGGARAPPAPPITTSLDCEIGTRIVRITDKITTEQILEFYEKQEEECKLRQSQSLPCEDYYGLPSVPVKCKENETLNTRNYCVRKSAALPISTNVDYGFDYFDTYKDEKQVIEEEVPLPKIPLANQTPPLNTANTHKLPEKSPQSFWQSMRSWLNKVTGLGDF